MSSILEALKKLEAEKHAHAVPVEAPPACDVDYTSGTLLGAIALPRAERHRLAPITLVLAGGFFAVLLIGVSVLLALVLLGGRLPATSNASAAVPVAQPTLQPETTPPEAALTGAPIAELPPTEVPEATALAPSTPMVTTPVEVAVVLPEPEPVRPAPKAQPPAQAPRRTEVAALAPAAEVRYEPYTPLPEERASDNARSLPLPADIRKLPLPTRNEREQYRIDNIALNMLNEANEYRPTGNAIINLEKVFVGETLPGSNAKLIDVQSHGIAIEIMSTRQRYYIPR